MAGKNNQDFFLINKKSIKFLLAEYTPRYPKMQSPPRCVCETLMPPKHPSYEKHDPDI